MARSFFAPLLKRGVENPAVPLTSESLIDVLGEGRTVAGHSVSSRSVLGIPAVWRAVRIRSGVGAMLPLQSFRLNTRRRVVSRLLDTPHPDLTQFEHREWCWQSLDLHGNVWCFKLRNQMGVVTALVPVNPSAVQVGPVDRDELTPDGRIYLVTLDSGRQVPMTSYELWHVRGFSTDGLVGIPPVSILRQGFGEMLAAQHHAADFFGKGGIVAGVLASDAKLDPGVAEKVKERWRKMVSGGSNEVAVLGAGLRFQPVQMPNRDAQFLESRKFQISEVARAFGIPPFMLYDVEKSTSWGTGIEQQSIGWVVYGLQPDLTRFEQRYTRDVVPPRAYAKHRVEGLLRGDSKARAAFYSVMRNIGALNVDEIRDLEDREPLPDGAGQTYLQPLNMAPLGADSTEEDDT